MKITAVKEVWTHLLLRLLLSFCFDLEDILNIRDGIYNMVKNTPLRVAF